MEVAALEVTAGVVTDEVSIRISMSSNQAVAGACCKLECDVISCSKMFSVAV